MTIRWLPLCVMTLLALFLVPSFSAAQSYTMGSTGFQLSGDLSLTFRELDRHSDLNANSRGDDPFNYARARLFVEKAWTDDITMFLEFLWDEGADARIQGAYLSFYELLHPALTLKVGMIPSPFGNYGHRSTYFNQNPLLGVPALWLTKTTLPSNGGVLNEDFFPYEHPGRGPVYAGGYDACWDYGMNLLVQEGIFQGQFAITLGALSNPYAVSNDGYQGIVNLGLAPTAGLRFGVSGAMGPWMRGGTNLADVYEEVEYAPASLAGLAPNRAPAAYHGEYGEPEEYMQTALGGWAEYSFGRFQFYSEAAQFEWEVPFLYEDRIDATSGYLEGKWSFLPSWYLAARYDIMRFGEIRETHEGEGALRPWQPDFNRVEAALGWRVIREGFIRLVYQGTQYQVGPWEDVDILALNFLFAF